ncbi:MAG TPA: undecaprenyl-diphosphatase UppP [bacterium]|nr:undecaprenyl-diphosphatase UppP [bacterium]HOR69551.1 undecaprenyl-diphosphatase UppP [bacterium]HOS98918.1 undecaprenyl-diphosphatase UppP [bacterium]HPL83756.1 undecaprenyl-diphosphatase UppP [bacterium]HQE63154.1 undecaprenyl-diphosphatase UppP [bacterium]
MDWWQALILGAVEGITEFLPISSTAHLRLFSEWLGIVNSDFSKSFDIFIQLGAILAVLAVYLKTLYRQPKIILKLIAAFIPTGIIGLLAYPLVKSQFMDSFWLIASALGLGGLFLIWFERYYHKKKVKSGGLEQISYQQACLIGLCQALAIIPGISRSAATIVGGLALGLKRSTIVEFSFLLALPTMLAATGLDLVKSTWSFGRPEIMALSIGLVMAFITAWLSVKWLLRFIERHNFRSFGWYRLALAIIVVIYLVVR